uniref:Uncharacterized protein n=1 Tax=Amphora coffeiformis TaxID=265554 RepID=A0A7S3P414_9STRA|eukprot:scaffold2179_cov165-Amphora_coffeaeformis.AAC.23
MKKLRPPNRDIVATKDNEEMLDSVLDYCVSDEDPELRRLARSRNRNKLSTVNYRNSRCDTGFGTELIGALAARMALPSACGPDLRKSRTVSQREYLYNQIADDRHTKPYNLNLPFDADPHKPNLPYNPNVVPIAIPSDRHSRQLGSAVNQRPIRKERKPSGIMSNRSETDMADDDWDMGVGTARSVWTGKSLKDQPLVEEDGEEDKRTYVIRVRSRESLVSEITEVVPGGGGTFYRKASGTSERALSGSEHASPPERQFSPTKKGTQASGSRGGPSPGKRAPVHSRRLHGQQDGDFEGSPRFRVFQGVTSDVESREVKTDEDTSHHGHIVNHPSPIAEESSLEAIEVIRKQTECEPRLPFAPKSNRRSIHGQNIYANSNSAFMPVRRREATGIHPQPSHQKPPLRLSYTKSTPDKEMSDKASQNTNSSASTKRRGNVDPKKKTIHPSDKSKCDTTVSSFSGGMSLDQLERQLDRPNPCIANTPLLGGLFACARGNKAERFAAEKEEWNHIMVFEPTKRLTEAAQHIPRPDTKFSPLSIITEETSLETNQRSTHAVHILPESPPKESILLGQRKAAAMRAQMAETLKNAMASSKTDELGKNLLSTGQSQSAQEDTDARDAGEAGDVAGDKRDVAPPTVTFSYDDEIHAQPTMNPAKDDKYKDENHKKNAQGTNSSIWPFLGVSNVLTSELDQLAPLGLPKPKQNSPKKPSRGRRLDSSRTRSRSPRKSRSPTRMHALSDTFSEYGTEFTTAPSFVHSRADSAFTGSWAQSPKGSVYERKRMASRETYPIFHWQASLIDDTSVGVMSLDY